MRLYLIAILTTTILFLFKSTSFGQNTFGKQGKIEFKGVLNLKELADYHKAHPVKPKFKDVPEAENEGRPKHTFFEPSMVHKMVRKEEKETKPHPIYLPVSPSPTDSFEATLDDSTTIPPDTHGAVDSNYCVAVTNQSVHIQTRKGGEVLNETLDNFWSPVLGSGSAFDPRVHFDPFTHRWLLVSDANALSSSSSILIAISATSDPTGSWYQYAALVDATSTYWLDFPNVGYNKKWIVITGNMYGISGGYGGSKIFVLNKSELLSGGSSVSYSTFMQDSSFAIAPALTYDTVTQNIYAVESWDGSNGLLKLWEISGAVGSETMNSLGYPKAPISWQYTSYANSASSGADFAPQKGTSHKIQTNDDRLYNLTYRNNKLWLAHNAFFPYSATTNPTHSSVMWWEIDTTGTPIQNGLINDNTGTYFYAFPSLAVNVNNDVLIGSSRFSSGMYPSCVYALHLHSDPADSMRPLDVYRHGLSNYYKTYSSTTNRWGDFSASLTDPKNDTDFWTVQETTPTVTNDWDTWWAHISLCTIPAKPSSVAGASSLCAGSTGTYSITPLSGATSYIWKILSGTGWSGSSTTDSIVLTAGSTNATISVAAANTCGTGIADTFTVTSVSAPSSGTISGNVTLCKSSTDTLKDTTRGGTWSSSDTGIATVDSNGVVRGATPGQDTITYSVTNICGTANTSFSITVFAGDVWTGSVSSSWGTGGNWACGIVPTASQAAIIPSAVSVMPVIASALTYTVDSLNIASGDTVTIDNSANLNVTGTVVDDGVVSGAGTLNLTGTTAQLLSGIGYISNLTVNNSVGANISPGDTAYITGVLTMSAGTFTTHNGLTLVSNASGTARIGTITGGVISGIVNCQKYIAVPGTDTNRRAYRFWAHPFSNSIPLSQIEQYIDITGSGGSINGFTTTATNAPSCQWYNTISGNSTKTADPGWTWFTSTNGMGANAFKPKQGINLFIRGKKGEGLNGSPYTPSPVTITMTGVVNEGTVIDTMIKGIHSDYNQIGNPYASPVDIGTIINNAKIAGSIKGAAFFVWNPYLAKAGAFEAKTISSTPYYLEAYCSFQVQAMASGKTLTFAESNKSAVDSESLLREENRYISLFVYDGSYNTWDKFYLSFNNEATNALDDYDAGKPINPDLNFYSLSGDNEKLSIDVRPYNEGEIIPLGITTDYHQQYIIKADNLFMSAGEQLYLHDKYLEQYIALQQGTEYRFNITDDAASQGNNRFELGLGTIPNKALAKNNGLSLSLIPNPAKDEVTCIYQSASIQNTSIRISDLSGANVVTKELGAQQTGIIKLPLGNMAAGVYIVELTSGAQRVTQQLVKE